VSGSVPGDVDEASTHWRLPSRPAPRHAQSTSADLPL